MVECLYATDNILFFILNGGGNKHNDITGGIYHNDWIMSFYENVINIILQLIPIHSVKGKIMSAIKWHESV